MNKNDRRKDDINKIGKEYKKFYHSYSLGVFIVSLLLGFFYFWFFFIN